MDAYYAKSVHEITFDVIKNKELPPEEEERLLHEAIPEDRTLLESCLPSTHSLIIALRERWSVDHSDHHHILL